MTECCFFEPKYDNSRVADNIASELYEETEDIGCLRDPELLAF